MCCFDFRDDSPARRTSHAEATRCHGTYGEKWTYPNKIIPIEKIGTDRKRFDGLSKKFVSLLLRHCSESRLHRNIGNCANINITLFNARSHSNYFIQTLL